jgi:hypothetical protein
VTLTSLLLHDARWFSLDFLIHSAAALFELHFCSAKFEFQERDRESLCLLNSVIGY